MKTIHRIAVAALAMLTVLSVLCGCSSAPSEPAKIVSVNDIYSDILALEILPEMYLLDDSYIDAYYGIDRTSVSDSVFAVADDTMLADTVIIVKISETGSASDIEQSFSTINEQRLFEMESYNPEQYARADKAVIKTIGGYVCYIISDDNGAVCTAIENNIG